MIPQWVAGAAARDAMYRRPSGGGGGGSSQGSVKGAASLAGIALIAGTTLWQAMEAHMGGFLGCVLAGLAALAAWWAAYRAKGVAGALAGAAVAGLASYSIYMMEGGGWFWPALVLALVGIDQWAWKKAKQ